MLSLAFCVLACSSVDIVYLLFAFWTLLFLYFIRTYFVGRIIYVIFALYYTVKFGFLWGLLWVAVCGFPEQELVTIMSERKVRVRFAPSPTGPLHIGGVRTALYNYLFAKQNGGEFIFRIEDTDSNRFVPGAEEYILESFRWLGIKFDEGVSFGGNYGPYRQSERRDIYKKYVTQLLESGKAYMAFDTPEEL